MTIKLTKADINWIERTADIETSFLFKNFNYILSIYKNAEGKQKELLTAQINELIDLYTFLKTLRSKLELWDSRYDIDTEIKYPDKDQQPKGDNKIQEKGRVD